MSSLYKENTDLKQLLANSVVSRAVTEAIRLSIFSLLSSPISVEKAAIATKTDKIKLGVLFELLLVVGLLEKDGDLWQNSHISKCLLDPKSECYQGNTLQFQTKRNQLIVDNLHDLLAGTRDGMKLLFEAQPTWKENLPFIPVERASLDDQNILFNFIMALPGIDKSSQLCDIGGGNGHISMGLIDRIGNLNVDLLELPFQIEKISEALKATTYTGNINPIPHDILNDEPPPKSYSIILLCDVLYVFLDKFEETITKYARTLEADGWLILKTILKDTNSPMISAATDKFVNAILGLKPFKEQYLDLSSISNVLSNVGLDVKSSIRIGQDDSSIVLAAQPKQK